MKINEMGSCNFLSFFLSSFCACVCASTVVHHNACCQCARTVTGHLIHPSQARREERCIKKKSTFLTVTYCDINLNIHFTSTLRRYTKKHREIPPSQTAIIQVLLHQISKNIDYHIMHEEQILTGYSTRT